MTINFENILISPDVKIRDALKVIDKEAIHAALVVLECNKLIGLVTDGDIRRGLINGIGLDESVIEVMNTSPMVAISSMSNEALKGMMQKKKILLLPILDDNGRLVNVKTLHETLEVERRDNPVFLMAGGFGSRLRPLTDKCPKPMLKVGGKPMLETLINHFKSHGFYKFYISTHYLPEVIMDYFGNGSQYDVEITYVHEDSPLGTGGALSLLPKSIPKLPLIMINGDILTNVDFRKVLDFHNKNQSSATMCVRDYEIKVPFGVIEGEGNDISKLVEKPTYRYFVNAGIYVISNKVIESLSINEHLDMPTLFENLKEKNKKILKFPIHEYWLDVGRHDDFNRAQIDIHDLGVL
ncbi:mannose-1-phosphate guanylyltransferase [Pseudoalteromonas sp. BSi20311]|jgi:dTDP-glucose pyrophosphorylase|uniref:nucleotidyltransferase family protein n=2 Tax=unclassified Pseudoalteromonas TaxID=194690 RepID=UPI000231AC46|nr:nucleotidyltransferase family protein [Pseudoalteromonas sp. BSi20311]GAA65009.1 mannose-1-phosphate guanylyltransferase [Pseudoalteromonas sp. BSi20311]